ncbi:glycosyltransferase [Siansivirga zeaxanthinifaciens]|uniref:Uncharacterized protein n=1 Tax=Siansivirga zeaxanthinifaciens CC-SAMT-1 TaxID=1454006 RepID=A0A0C5WHY3_9FLAO|nr:glycosyltransferase [Siansivirga zeaxanthinifaciens]AJR04764.1 hypothetical protein AW14_03660 [Siansivirga zeaxanthinifaciens CC-SAMT-1]
MKMNQKYLTTALILNAIILLFPSNFKFIPIVIFGIISLRNFKKMDFKYLVLMSVPYLIILLGVIHSNNLDRAFSQIQTGLSLFFYPLFFSMLPEKSLNEINKRKVDSAFIISIVIFSSTVFLYFFLIKGESLIFLIQHYITLIDKIIWEKYQIHSLYLALLLIISIILSFQGALKTKSKYFIFYIINIFYSLSLLAVMNKRASIILIIVTSLLFLVTLKGNLKKNGIITMFGGIILLFGLVIYLPRFDRNSFSELKKIEQSINDPKTSIGTRIVLIKATFEIFKNNPLFGVGTGDDMQILSETTTKLSNGIVVNFNSHNQYNSYLIRTGLFGLSIFLFYCFFLLKLAFRSKDIVFICLLIIFFGNMLIENILEREAGVLVFSFFISYYSRLYFKNKRNKLLLIGPLPEPTTGVSLANKVVLEKLKEINSHRIETINTSYNKFEENLGAFSLKKALFFFKLNFQAYKILKVDMVYITPGQTFFGVIKYAIFILLSKLLGKEIIIHVHGNYLGKEFSQLKGIRKTIFKWLLDKTSKGIVLSESLKGNMSPFIKDEKIFVLYNFVEDYLFVNNILDKVKKANKKIKIIFLSNLMEEKGIFDLLEALKILEQHKFNYEAKIAGNIDAKHKELTERYFRELKNVTYCGVVSGNSKKELLLWGNIFVLPTYYEMEGQPISILEAMATGNLILTTRHAGIPDIFSEGINGFFVEKRNASSIASKITQLNEDHKLINSVGEHNYNFAKNNYRVKNFMNNFIKIINE